MFGFVTANLKELTEEQKQRYNAVYCGICRQIRLRSSQSARLGLSYDMAFLALLLMSLYEPDEENGRGRCIAHPAKARPWTDNEYIRYAARMNVALAAYKARDDWDDDGKYSAKLLATIFGRHEAEISAAYPRQCAAIADCIRRLSALEKAGCANPDEPAGCFGELMAELLVVHEDRWAEDLRQMGFYLGRFIYLADAAIDYRRDVKHRKYNPFAAQGCGEDFEKWEQYLVLAMAQCTESYERLPLVEDKGILDNILYSGIWLSYRRMQRESGKENQDG
jgi:hypothetical protein